MPPLACTAAARRASSTRAPPPFVPVAPTSLLPRAPAAWPRATPLLPCAPPPVRASSSSEPTSVRNRGSVGSRLRLSFPPPWPAARPAAAPPLLRPSPWLPPPRSATGAAPGRPPPQQSSGPLFPCTHAPPPRSFAPRRAAAEAPPARRAAAAGRRPRVALPARTQARAARSDAPRPCLLPAAGCRPPLHPAVGASLLWTQPCAQLLAAR